MSERRQREQRRREAAQDKELTLLTQLIAKDERIDALEAVVREGLMAAEAGDMRAWAQSAREVLSDA